MRSTCKRCGVAFISLRRRPRTYCCLRCKYEAKPTRIRRVSCAFIRSPLGEGPGTKFSHRTLLGVQFRLGKNWFGVCLCDCGAAQVVAVSSLRDRKRGKCCLTWSESRLAIRQPSTKMLNALTKVQNFTKEMKNANDKSSG